MLAPGARLVATYKGSEYEIVIAEVGRLRFPGGSGAGSL
jgi:hypothetical protein